MWPFQRRSPGILLNRGRANDRAGGRDPALDQVKASDWCILLHTATPGLELRQIPKATTTVAALKLQIHVATVHVFVADLHSFHQ